MPSTIPSLSLSPMQCSSVVIALRDTNPIFLSFLFNYNTVFIIGDEGEGGHYILFSANKIPVKGVEFQMFSLIKFRGFFRVTEPLR